MWSSKAHRVHSPWPGPAAHRGCPAARVTSGQPCSPAHHEADGRTGHIHPRRVCRQRNKWHDVLQAHLVFGAAAKAALGVTRNHWPSQACREMPVHMHRPAQRSALSTPIRHRARAGISGYAFQIASTHSIVKMLHQLQPFAHVVGCYSDPIRTMPKTVSKRRQPLHAIRWHNDPIINNILKTTVERDWINSGFSFRPPGSEARYRIIQFKFKCAKPEDAQHTECVKH